MLSSAVLPFFCRPALTNTRGDINFADDDAAAAVDVVVDGGNS